MNGTDFWQRLLRRWFVQYNPLYLLSATFVLVGVNVGSSALARHGALGGMAMTAIAELYAWSLIGGAAFLKRTGLRRPAVMLALLAALYQCDPTLHTETCAAQLGAIGVIGGAAWLASFAGKLVALVWALELELSRAATLLPLVGAFGLVALPRALPRLDAADAQSLLTGWTFALLALGMWTRRDVASRSALDAWGRTVLRRCVRAVWLLWAALALAHACFWADDLGLTLYGFVPMALLLSTRWYEREIAVWAAAAGALLVAASEPGLFPSSALMTALVLALRAFRLPVTDQPNAAVPSGAPYRTSAGSALPAGPGGVSFGRARPEAVSRLLTGAVYALYLALWTAGWSGGAWPEHSLALDVALSALLVPAIWKARVRAAAILPLAATYAHLGVQTGWLAPPATRLGWGLACIAAGFTLLFGSLLSSWYWRQAPPD